MSKTGLKNMGAAEAVNVLLSHRSIRKFTNQQISDELLELIIRSGQAASTSSHIQSTSIIRVSDKDKREKMAELSGQQNYVATAAEFLVCCADIHRSAQLIRKKNNVAEFDWMEQLITATVDVSIFTQNMVIAAESQGLGCCYIGGIRNHPDEVSELLGLPELVYPVFGLCLGYPDHNPAIKPRLPYELVLHQDAYQAVGDNNTHVVAYDKTVSEYYHSRTNGKLNKTWTQQLLSESSQKVREHMADFLKSKGFAKK